MLGALHGPAELLPISSSGHVSALSWLFGSTYGNVDAEVRKGLEVALHAGSMIGLLVARRGELWDELRGLDAQQVLVIAAGSAPAGAAGLVLERPIASSLGTPATIAAGLLAGGLAMALADRAAQERRAEDASLRDGLWLGLAQTSALIPGVSRGGVTLAAARTRRFRREDAGVLSRRLALPVIAGATLLKASRLRRDELRGEAPALLAGTASSFLSTLLALRLTQRAASRPLWPYGVYRAGLAGLILLRLGRGAQDQGHARSVW